MHQNRLKPVILIVLSLVGLIVFAFSYRVIAEAANGGSGGGAHVISSY